VTVDENLKSLQHAIAGPPPPPPAGAPAGDALDLLLAVAEKKRPVLLSTLAGGAVAAAIAFLLPPLYTANATIMPPQQPQSGAAALLGQAAPIAAVVGGGLSLKNPADLYVGILGSRTILDRIVERFDLRQVYRSRTLTQARKTLVARSSFLTGKDPLIRISVEDADPRRAADLANAYVSELHAQNDRLALTESAQRRLFFERRLDAEKTALANAEHALRRMQERTGVLRVDSQVEVVIRSIAQLRAEITGREVALSSLESAATPENPEVIRRQTELAALREQLRKLEAAGQPRGRGESRLSAAEVPGAGLEYIRAVRDVKYHETLFELLARQYEAARIDEAKQAPVIQVVDAAVPPERRSWPPRALLTAAGALGAGFLACLAAVASARLRRPEPAAKLRLLRARLIG
jgi:uncharacterized protein involved in exopolysaccharide biosynthesis